MTAIQRFGGGIQLNIRFHTLLLEGVFARAAFAVPFVGVALVAR